MNTKTGLTKGTWRIGKQAGTVVSDKKVITLSDTGHDDIDYYGGYLIAESIARKEDAKLIAAAPIMLETLQIINGDIDRYPNPYTALEKKKLIEQAINRALGEE